MEFDIVKLITDLGIPVALVVYFLFKDWKITDQLLKLVGRVEHLLTKIEEQANKEVL